MIHFSTRAMSSVGAIALSLLTASPASGQMLNEDRILTATDAANFDAFGSSVSVSGSTAVIGANRDDDGGADSGSAYVFNTMTGQQVHKLTASDAAADDQFGFSVAVSGTTAVVSALFDEDAGKQTGAAYVFDTVTGQQLFKLTASDAAEFDNFGYSVAVSGTTAVIGAVFSNASGSAYVFDTTTGQQLFKLTASDASSGDWFGSSVSVSGTTAVIGALRDDDVGSNSGSAYVFDTTTGQQLFKLTASDAAANDIFGSSVSVSGAIAVIGAFLDDDGGLDSGSAYVFDTTTGQQLYKLTASDAAGIDRFGIAVALTSGSVVVGSFNESAYIINSGSPVLLQPQSTAVNAGDPVSLSIIIEEDAGVTYQWRRDGIDLTDGGNISGVNTTTLQIDASENDIGFYDCAFTSRFGPPAMSNSAVLAVRADPNACTADLNGDGVLNFFDVSLFLSVFNAGCP